MDKRRGGRFRNQKRQTDARAFLGGKLRHLQNEHGKIAQWRDEQKGNLNVIAVHMPRYEADTNIAQVRADVEKYNVTEPCAIDNRHKLKKAFQNDQGWVPAYYLFDRQGKLKSFAAGERGFGMLKAAMERLLATETAATVA